MLRCRIIDNPVYDSLTALLGEGDISLSFEKYILKIVLRRSVSNEKGWFYSRLYDRYY